VGVKASYSRWHGTTRWHGAARARHAANSPPRRAAPPPPGNLAGLLLSPFILVTFGWRALFLVFGVLGAPLLAIWSAAVPDRAPARPPPGAAAGRGGGAAGAAAGGGVTLGRLLSHPATWAIVVVNFVNHWGYFIYLNWMPTYFSKVWGGLGSGVCVCGGGVGTHAAPRGTGGRACRARGGRAGRARALSCSRSEPCGMALWSAPRKASYMLPHAY
jgi:hypothetical protein